MGGILGRLEMEEFSEENESYMLDDLRGASLSDFPAILGFKPGNDYCELRKEAILVIRGGGNQDAVAQEIAYLIKGQRLSIADEGEQDRFYVGFLIDSALIWQELGKPDILKRALFMAYAFAKEKLSGAIADIVLEKINQLNEGV